MTNGTSTHYNIVAHDMEDVWLVQSRDEETIEDAIEALDGFKKNYPDKTFRIMKVVETREVLEDYK